MQLGIKSGLGTDILIIYDNRKLQYVINNIRYEKKLVKLCYFES